MNEDRARRSSISVNFYNGSNIRDLLDQNAKTLREMHERIHSTFAERGKNTEAWKAWEKACALAHARYDELAFPGGLDRAFTQLAAGDLETAEIAVLYCEMRPYYFRSGYHRNKFVKLLSRIELPRQLSKRLDSVREEMHRRKLANREKRAKNWRQGIIGRTLL